MNLDLKKLKHALDTSQNQREVYFNYYHKDKPFISVNDLLESVKKSLDKTIVLSFHEDDHSTHSMRSFVHVELDGSFEICLMSGMTNCWNRFALCKELFHVIMDTENSRNPSLSAHLMDYRSSVMDGAIEGAESSKSEMLTEFSAMQFLFPYARRLECLEEIKARSSDPLKVVCEEFAVKFRIPRLLIEDYLSPVMIEFFDPIAWIDKSDKR